MVNLPLPDNADEFDYDELTEKWPRERPSRKRAKRSTRGQRQIVVRTKRLEEPDVARMSRALLAAQRELAKLQDEAAARQHPGGGEEQ